MSGKVIRGPWEMSSQEKGHALLQGWQAARAGEPFDFSWGWHVQQGYRLYLSTHAVRSPVANQ